MKSERDVELGKERFNAFGDGKSCEGCIFSNGRPDICTCDIFTGERLNLKPDRVFLEGGKCKYYRDK